MTSNGSESGNYYHHSPRRVYSEQLRSLTLQGHGIELLPIHTSITGESEWKIRARATSEAISSGSNAAGPSNAKKRKAEDQHTTLSVSDAEEIVQQLKEKFNSTTARSERIKILSVLPKSWSNRKIAKEFGVSRYLARRAKELLAEKGILSSPNPKGAEHFL